MERKKAQSQDFRLQSSAAAFNIPKIRKVQSTERLSQVSVSDRGALQLMREVDNTCFDPGLKSRKQWRENVIYMINPTADVERRYREKRVELKEQSSGRPLQEVYGFFVVKDKGQAYDIARNGMRVNQSKNHCLGDPSQGVYLFRYLDVALLSHMEQCRASVLVFKVLQGRTKQVHVSDSMSYGGTVKEPTPLYDAHISQSAPKVGDPIPVICKKSQMYLYEYTDEALPSHWPRQCLPYALIEFCMDRRAVEKTPKHLSAWAANAGWTSASRTVSDGARKGYLPEPFGQLGKDLSSFAQPVPLMNPPTPPLTPSDAESFSSPPDQSIWKTPDDVLITRDKRDGVSADPRCPQPVFGASGADFTQPADFWPGLSPVAAEAPRDPRRRLSAGDRATQQQVDAGSLWSKDGGAVRADQPVSSSPAQTVMEAISKLWGQTNTFGQQIASHGSTEPDPMDSWGLTWNGGYDEQLQNGKALNQQQEQLNHISSQGLVHVKPTEGRRSLDQEKCPTAPLFERSVSDSSCLLSKSDLASLCEPVHQPNFVKSFPVPSLSRAPLKSALKKTSATTAVQSETDSKKTKKLSLQEYLKKKKAGTQQNTEVNEMSEDNSSACSFLSVPRDPSDTQLPVADGSANNSELSQSNSPSLSQFDKQEMTGVNCEQSAPGAYDGLNCQPVYSQSAPGAYDGLNCQPVHSQGPVSARHDFSLNLQQVSRRDPRLQVVHRTSSTWLQLHPNDTKTAASSQGVGTSSCYSEVNTTEHSLPPTPAEQRAGEGNAYQMPQAADNSFAAGNHSQVCAETKSMKQDDSVSNAVLINTFADVPDDLEQEDALYLSLDDANEFDGDAGPETTAVLSTDSGRIAEGHVTNAAAGFLGLENAGPSEGSVSGKLLSPSIPTDQVAAIDGQNEEVTQLLRIAKGLRGKPAVSTPDRTRTGSEQKTMNVSPCSMSSKESRNLSPSSDTSAHISGLSLPSTENSPEQERLLLSVSKPDKFGKGSPKGGKSKASKKRTSSDSLDSNNDFSAMIRLAKGLRPGPKIQVAGVGKNPTDDPLPELGDSRKKRRGTRGVSKRNKKLGQQSIATLDGGTKQASKEKGKKRKRTTIFGKKRTKKKTKEEVGGTAAAEDIDYTDFQFDEPQEFSVSISDELDRGAGEWSPRQVAGVVLKESGSSHEGRGQAQPLSILGISHWTEALVQPSLDPQVMLVDLIKAYSVTGVADIEHCWICQKIISREDVERNEVEEGKPPHAEAPDSHLDSPQSDQVLATLGIEKGAEAPDSHLDSPQSDQVLATLGIEKGAEAPDSHLDSPQSDQVLATLGIEKGAEEKVAGEIVSEQSVKPPETGSRSERDEEPCEEPCEEPSRGQCSVLHGESLVPSVEREEVNNLSATDRVKAVEGRLAGSQCDSQLVIDLNSSCADRDSKLDLAVNHGADPVSGEETSVNTGVSQGWKDGKETTNGVKTLGLEHLPTESSTVPSPVAALSEKDLNPDGIAGGKEADPALGALQHSFSADSDQLLKETSLVCRGLTNIHPSCSLLSPLDPLSSNTGSRHSFGISSEDSTEKKWQMWKSSQAKRLHSQFHDVDSLPSGQKNVPGDTSDTELPFHGPRLSGVDSQTGESSDNWGNKGNERHRSGPETEWPASAAWQMTGESSDNWGNKGNERHGSGPETEWPASAAVQMTGESSDNWGNKGNERHGSGPETEWPASAAVQMTGESSDNWGNKGNERHGSGPETEWPASAAVQMNRSCASLQAGYWLGIHELNTLAQTSQKNEEREVCSLTKISPTKLSRLMPPENIRSALNTAASQHSPQDFARSSFHDGRQTGPRHSAGQTDHAVARLKASSGFSREQSNLWVQPPLKPDVVASGVEDIAVLCSPVTRKDAKAEHTDSVAFFDKLNETVRDHSVPLSSLNSTIPGLDLVYGSSANTDTTHHDTPSKVTATLISTRDLQGVKGAQGLHADLVEKIVQETTKNDQKDGEKQDVDQPKDSEEKPLSTKTQRSISSGEDLDIMGTHLEKLSTFDIVKKYENLLSKSLETKTKKGEGGSDKNQIEFETDLDSVSERDITGCPIPSFTRARNAARNKAVSQDACGDKGSVVGHKLVSSSTSSELTQGNSSIHPVPSEGNSSIHPVPSQGNSSIHPVPSEGNSSIHPVPSQGNSSIHPVPSHGAGPVTRTSELGQSPAHVHDQMLNNVGRFDSSFTCNQYLGRFSGSSLYPEPYSTHLAPMPRLNAHMQLVNTANPACLLNPAPVGISPQARFIGYAGQCLPYSYGQPLVPPVFTNPPPQLSQPPPPGVAVQLPIPGVTVLQGAASTEPNAVPFSRTVTPGLSGHQYSMPALQGNAVSVPPPQSRLTASETSTAVAAAQNTASQPPSDNKQGSGEASKNPSFSHSDNKQDDGKIDLIEWFTEREAKEKKDAAYWFSDILAGKRSAPAAAELDPEFKKSKVDVSESLNPVQSQQRKCEEKSRDSGTSRNNRGGSCDSDKKLKRRSTSSSRHKARGRSGSEGRESGNDRNTTRSGSCDSDEKSKRGSTSNRHKRTSPSTSDGTSSKKRRESSDRNRVSFRVGLSSEALTKRCGPLARRVYLGSDSDTDGSAEESSRDRKDSRKETVHKADDKERRVVTEASRRAHGAGKSSSGSEKRLSDSHSRRTKEKATSKEDEKCVAERNSKSGDAAKTSDVSTKSPLRKRWSSPSDKWSGSPKSQRTSDRDVYKKTCLGSHKTDSAATQLSSHKTDSSATQLSSHKTDSSATQLSSHKTDSSATQLSSHKTDSSATQLSSHKTDSAVTQHEPADTDDEMNDYALALLDGTGNSASPLLAMSRKISASMLKSLSAPATEGSSPSDTVSDTSLAPAPGKQSQSTLSEKPLEFLLYAKEVIMKKLQEESAPTSIDATPETSITCSGADATDSSQERAESIASFSNTSQVSEASATCDDTKANGPAGDTAADNNMKRADLSLCLNLSPELNADAISEEEMNYLKNIVCRLARLQTSSIRDKSKENAATAANKAVDCPGEKAQKNESPRKCLPPGQNWSPSQTSKPIYSGSGSHDGDRYGESVTVNTETQPDVSQTSFNAKPHASQATTPSAQNKIPTSSTTPKTCATSKPNPSQKIPTRIELDVSQKTPTQIKSDPSPKTPTQTKPDPSPKTPTQIKSDPSPKTPTQIKFDPSPKTPTQIMFDPSPKTPTQIKSDPSPKTPTQIKPDPSPKTPTQIKFDLHPKPRIQIKLDVSQKLPICGPSPTQAKFDLSLKTRAATQSDASLNTPISPTPRPASQICTDVLQKNETDIEPDISQKVLAQTNHDSTQKNEAQTKLYSAQESPARIKPPENTPSRTSPAAQKPLIPNQPVVPHSQTSPVPQKPLILNQPVMPHSKNRPIPQKPLIPNQPVMPQRLPTDTLLAGSEETCSEEMAGLTSSQETCNQETSGPSTVSQQSGVYTVKHFLHSKFPGIDLDDVVHIIPYELTADANLMSNKAKKNLAFLVRKRLEYSGSKASVSNVQHDSSSVSNVQHDSSLPVSDTTNSTQQDAARVSGKASPPGVCTKQSQPVVDSPPNANARTSTNVADTSDTRTSKSTSSASASETRTSKSTSSASASETRTSKSTSSASASDIRTSKSTSSASPSLSKSKVNQEPTMNSVDGAKLLLEDFPGTQIKLELHLVEGCYKFLKATCAVRALPEEDDTGSEESAAQTKGADREAFTRVLDDLHKALIEVDKGGVGRPNQRVPDDILLLGEKDAVYTEERVFVFLMTTIPPSPYSKLRNLRRYIESRQERLRDATCYDKKINVTKEEQRLQELQNQRLTLMRTFTGVVNRNRVKKLTAQRDQYVLVQTHLLRVLGHSSVERMVYFRAAIGAIQSHLQVVETEMRIMTLGK